jgi:hypothetical protein
MPEVNMLVIGRHKEIMQTVLRLINQNPAYNASGATTNDEAVALFRSGDFQLIILGGGVDRTSEAFFRKTFAEIKPGIKIIQHFGGGSGLLENEIRAALENNADGIFNV